MIETRGRKRGPVTIDSWMIENCEVGYSFYSDKDDRHLTALAAQRKRRISTERLITITTGGKDPVAKYITKVTLHEHTRH